MTPQAIRDGFEQLRSDEQMRGLADAARSRSEADWLVGINGTRAMTAFNSRDGGFFLTTVGRVQTPTLSHRGRARGEDPQARGARLLGGQGQLRRRRPAQYDGKWFDPKWKKNPDDAERARRPAVERAPTPRPSPHAVRGQPASVTEEAKPSTQSSPLLYDLTTLQREANSRFGFSAKTTLSHRPGAVREAQGADLPAYRLARPARGLPGGGEEHLRDDRQGRPAGPAAARWPRTPRKALEGGLRQADQARVRQRQGVGPLRHHPDAAGAQEPDRDRGQALRPGGQALPGGVLPAGRVHGHDAHLARSRPAARSTSSRPTARCWSSRAGWRCTARRRRTTTPTWWPWQPGEMVRTESVDVNGAEDQAAGALHRGHAAAARWKARAS